MTQIDQAQLLGIFDSGVGGFSVYRKIREVSKADTVYYGDCARAPYGNKEETELIGCIKDDIRFLLDEDVTHFVNACNSMSVMTTDRILAECGISPNNYTDMIRAFSKHSDFKKEETVLVIATVATLRSRVYQDFLEHKGVTVFEYGFTSLARAIEESAKREVILEMLEPALIYAQENNVTKIVYGCTHYPLIHDIFVEVSEKVMWSGEFVNPAIYVAKEVVSWNLSGERKFTPYSSKDTPAFIKNVVSVFSM